MSPLSELQRLLLDAKWPPKLTEEQKADPMVAAGYAWGFREALTEAIEIAEEAEEL